MQILFVFMEALIISYFMSIPVGPVGALCVRRTLEVGKWPGFIVGLGASFSDTFYGSVIAFNIIFISSFIADYRIYIQIVGIIILFFIGIQSFITKPRKDKNKYKFRNIFSDFFSSFFINITNPSIIISFAALLVAFHFDELLTSEILSFSFVFGIFIGSVLWWLTLSSIASYFQRKIKKDITLMIHRLSGALILIFAFILLLFTLWELF